MQHFDFGCLCTDACHRDAGGCQCEGDFVELHLECLLNYCLSSYCFDRPEASGQSLVITLRWSYHQASSCKPAEVPEVALPNTPGVVLAALTAATAALFQLACVMYKRNSGRAQ